MSNLLTLNHSPTAVFAPDTVRVQEWPTQADTASTEAQCFQDIGASTDTTIDVDFMLFEQIGPPLMEFV